MNPYFEVGEEVILCSTMHPEFNGEYLVIEALSGNEFASYIRNLGYRVAFDTGPFYYNLGFLIDTEEEGGFEWYHWEQTALRKKHKPSTDSFTEMMSNIDELVTL